jgi:hypothetical protein
MGVENGGNPDFRKYKTPDLGVSRKMPIWV